MSRLKNTFEGIVDALRQECLDYYGARLKSLAVFGSVARSTMAPDSDIDVLLIIHPLPDGRMARMDEFSEIERRLEPRISDAYAQGIHTCLSPVFKTPAELLAGSWLLLDLTDQARVVFDRESLLASYLQGLRDRLGRMGAKRVYKGGGYYWVLKPDLLPGEHFQL